MKISASSIYRSGLILISVPLLFEVLLGFAMFGLQFYNQGKIQGERSAQEIIFRANELWIKCSEAGMRKFYASIFAGPEPSLEATAAQLHQEFAQVQKLVAHDPLQMQRLDVMNQCASDAFELMNQLQSVAAAGQSPVGRVRVLRQNSETLALIREKMVLMSHALLEFKDPDYFHNFTAATEVTEATGLIDSLVLGTLVTSLLVATLVFARFIGRIKSGVETIIKNTELFRLDSELLPNMAGTDELSTVDSAFHKMAFEIREAQRLKQAFVAMISHDLRTPLTSVLAYFSSLQLGSLGDTSEQALLESAQASRNIEQVVQLITDFLDLEKIDAGKMELAIDRLDCEAAILKSIAATKELALEKNIEIRFIPTDAVIAADQDRLLQALRNLLSKAISLAPNGSDLNVSVATLDEIVELRISATKLNFSDEQVAALFDRYQNTTTLGLSLELALCKALVSLHNGTAGASQEGNSTTYFVRIPQRPVHASQDRETNLISGN